MSDRYVTVVRRRHVRYREIVALAATLIALSVLMLGFYLGQHAALSGIEEQEAATPMNMPPPPSPCELREADMQAKVQEVQAQHDVDVAALELARKALLTRDGRVAELEASLSFYRGLMAPEEGKQGVVLKAPQWIAGAEAGVYHYRAVVSQVDRKHSVVKGSMTVVLLGEQNGEPAEFALHNISASHDEKRVLLRFKYFQVIEGHLTLPSGFSPRQVRVELNITKPKKKQSTALFAWQVQEEFHHEG